MDREQAVDKAGRATIAAIVPAAGCGARTGLNGNKVLAPLLGKPLLAWTLHALLDSQKALGQSGYELQQLLIAARREEFDLIHDVIDMVPAQNGISIKCVEGGRTRQESVMNAARAASQAEYFLVHDAARPLITPKTIERVCRAAAQSGAAIAALPASDTLKVARVLNGQRLIESTLARAQIYCAQTPQVFRSNLFLKALERAEREQFEGTDCASLMENAGYAVTIVDGEQENFKVTYAADLQRTENVLRTQRRLN
jgi:2-C-methyl-D-erythritol 4-phosphate cytidylyltransferase